MGSPYLNSGETIVLTANRVRLDAVPHDVMLTTERIFLIDNRNVRFEPRIIPLSAILSVQGGKTPVLDPVITLLFRPGAGGAPRQPLNLVFSQDPNENRKNERDDWVRTIIRLSIARQEREGAAVAPAPPQVISESGLRPATRHWVAPEKVRPLSNMVNRETPPLPLLVIPDEVDGGGEIPVPVATVAMERREQRSPEPVPEEPAPGLHSPIESPPDIPAIPARVIIPHIIEELLPARAGAAPAVDQLPEAVADKADEALTRSILTAIRSMTVTEERAPEPSLVPEAVPAQEPAPGIGDIMKAAAIPVPVAAQTPEEPEIGSTVPTQPGEPAPPEPPAALPSEPLLVPEIPLAGPGDRQQLPVPLPVVEKANLEPAGQKDTETIVPPVPVTAEPPPIRHPIPPAREIRPLRTTLAYAGVLLVAIVLVAAGAMLFLQGPGHTGNSLPPAPGPVPGTTLPLPSATVQPTTHVPSTGTPVARGTTTPLTSSPASPVPQAGVWVRINSTVYYFGDAGNPELMQPVSGTGDRFYKVPKSDRPVQVSVQKQDNSGALLAVAIYRDGILIGSRSVTSPMGTVDLLIDPLTARAPGLTGNDTLPEHAAVPAGLENY